MEFKMLASVIWSPSMIIVMENNRNMLNIFCSSSSLNPNIPNQLDLKIFSINDIIIPMKRVDIKK